MSRALEIIRSLGIEALAQPAWLAVLLPLAVIAVLVAGRARPAALPWAGLGEARAAGAGRLDASRALGHALRAGALIALALVLARPVGVHRTPPEPGLGLDLVLAVDASGSMRALDAKVGGEPRTRLALAREAVSRFAEQRAAEGDRVALVVFGETAFTQCPLTSDGGLLAGALARVEAGMAGEATALGDALALSVKRALAGEARDADGTPLAGRVVVLLSDGRNNAGRLPVDLAVALAASRGVRVHTVGIGSAGTEVPMVAREGGTARRLRFERHDVDAETLADVARRTGGRFFRARRSRDLERVYADIDALERVSRPLAPQIRHSDRPEPLLAAAGAFLLVELVATRVVRRRLP